LYFILVQDLVLKFIQGDSDIFNILHRFSNRVKHWCNARSQFCVIPVFIALEFPVTRPEFNHFNWKAKIWN